MSVRGLFLRTVVVEMLPTIDMTVGSACWRRKKWLVQDFYLAGLVPFSRDGLFFCRLNSNRRLKQIITTKVTEIVRPFTLVQMCQTAKPKGRVIRRGNQVPRKSFKMDKTVLLIRVTNTDHQLLEIVKGLEYQVGSFMLLVKLILSSAAFNRISGCNCSYTEQ